MELKLNTSSLNQNSYIKSSLANNNQHDHSQLFVNFTKACPTKQKPKPYDPNCSTYQYNVIVEGVIFDVLAPCDLLNDFTSEKKEKEE
ncbi:unnamed protein product [Paramecium primaurelia]|uniref:Uncharacterized protein n=1 Tax=Paramecium primaurelia TaxID=5886 RepID=A0A8S1KBN0_PARPR|nr:unnamed protein product [Paramecium primaurelia]